MMIVKYPIKSQYAWMKRTEGEKKTDWCSITNEMRDEALVSPTSISAIVQWDWDVERIIMTIRPFWFSIRIRFNMQKWEWVFSFCFVCGFFVPRRVSNIKNSNSTIASNQTDYQIFSASFPTIFLTISKPFSANCHSRNFNQFRSIPRERHIHIEMWPIWSTDEVLNCVACIGFIDGLKVVKHLLKKQRLRSWCYSNSQLWCNFQLNIMNEIVTMCCIFDDFSRMLRHNSNVHSFTCLSKSLETFIFMVFRTKCCFPMSSKWRTCQWMNSLDLLEIESMLYSL